METCIQAPAYKMYTAILPNLLLLKRREAQPAACTVIAVIPVQGYRYINCSMPTHMLNAGSSEYESASQQSSSSGREKDPPVILMKGQTPEGCQEVTSDNLARNKNSSGIKGSPDTIELKHASHSEGGNSVANSELWALRQPPSDGYSLSYPRLRRREPTDSACSPSRVHHRRIQSISICGYSSRSTSAHSTLSERAERPAVATEETESLNSLRTRATTQSQVEQSRVDTSRVIDELMQESDLSRSAEEESSQLQMYVDRSNKGGLVVAGPNLERLATPPTQCCLSEDLFCFCMQEKFKFETN